MTNLKDRVFVGYVIGWSLSGSFQKGEAQRRAAALGLDVDFGFPRINENSVYRRAVTAAVRGRSDDRQYVVKLVEDSVSFIVHEFLSANVRDLAVSSLTDKSALFSHETCTRFDKLAYSEGKLAPQHFLQVEDPEHPIAKAVAAAYQQGAVDIHYTIGDVRTAFQRAFVRWCGLSILPHGGMWFVPAAYADKVEAWAEFVNGWPGCRASLFEQYDARRVMDEIRIAAESTLEAQLGALLSDLERFGAKESVRLSTLEARVDAFDALRGRAEVFERLLGHSANDIKERLVAAQEALVSAINDMAANKQA